MFKRLSIETMRSGHIDDAFALWQRQFAHFCADTEMFPYWQNNDAGILEFIKSHAEAGNGLVAILDRTIVGYLAYDAFTFHGAESAFLPFPGNAAILENRGYIYLALYKAIAQKWLENGIKTHYFTICANDNELIKCLFDLGFGSYVVDAFAKPKLNQAIFDNQIVIEKALPSDTEELYPIVQESRDYYSGSPLFLKMDAYPEGELASLLERGNVFLAKQAAEIVGFMNLSIAKNDDIFRMCAKRFGQIDEIGAYIKEEYRNRNIGRQFIKAIADFSLQSNLPCVHVDFESANLYANKFWRKYFTPVMLSVKRTLHTDC